MFSIVIPLYNKAAYIQRCLDAVFQQTYRDFEVIVVDDGSTDDGVAVVLQQFQDKVRLVSQKNQGVSAARNSGIALATFPFIAFLDADDCWNARYLEKMAEVISKEGAENVTIIGCHYTRNSQKLADNDFQFHYYKIADYFKTAIRNTLFTSSSSVVKTDFFKMNSGFNTNLKRGEDIDVWLRAVASGGSAYYIKNTLVYYSEEDINQATATKPDVALTLVGTINTLYAPLMATVNDPEFSKFISKYVYFNLYPYYFDANWHAKAKESLKSNKHRYFLLDLLYGIPLKIGARMIASKKYNRYLRLYLKFILRKILK